MIIGVAEESQWFMSGLQAVDKESASCWRESFKDLKRRGLDANRIFLGVMDGLAGLEKVFKEEFPKAKFQHFQVHVARNVMAKVPRKMKKAVVDDMRSIFYASSKNKSLELFAEFNPNFVF